MKRATKILALILAVFMTMAMFSACGGDDFSSALEEAMEGSEEKMAKLAGTWLMIEQDSEEQVMVLLESIDLYEEEIALVDKSSLRYAWIYEFDTAGNFRQADDIEMTKYLVAEFYEGVFEALYEGRATLDDLYPEDLASMTQEENQLFYANLYGFETFDDLINQFVENAYLYDEWEDLRNGTYSIDGNMLDIVDGTDSYYLGYELDGDILTITYSDGEEIYIRKD